MEILTQDRTMPIIASSNSITITGDIDFYIQDVILNTTGKTLVHTITADGDYHLRYTLTGGIVNNYSPEVVNDFYIVPLIDMDYNVDALEAIDYAFRNISYVDMLVCAIRCTSGVCTILYNFENASNLTLISDNDLIPPSIINVADLTAERLGTPLRLILNGDLSGEVTFDGSEGVVQLTTTIEHVPTADRFSTPFDITLNGGVTGTISNIDGSGNITATVAVSPEGHIHSEYGISGYPCTLR